MSREPDATQPLSGLSTRDPRVRSSLARFEQRLRDEFAYLTENVSDLQHGHQDADDGPERDPEGDRSASGGRATLDEVVNTLIRGGLLAANRSRHPDTPPAGLLDGILAHWRGDVVVDQVAVAGPGSRLSRNARPVCTLTLGVAMSHPGQRRVPPVVTSAYVDRSSRAHVHAAATVLDAISSGGLRPGSRSHAVTDLFLPSLRGWSEALLVRDYRPVFRYRSNARLVHELTAHDQTPSMRPAAHLFNGVPVCPGVNGRALEGIGFKSPELRAVSGELDYDAREVHDHDLLEDFISPMVMPRHSRPELISGDGSSGVQDTPYARVQVLCPASAGKVRCPLKPETMNVSNSVPMILDPPSESPPATCTRTYSTLTMSRRQFADYQDHLAGTWAHESLFATGRAAGESFTRAFEEHAERTMPRSLLSDEVDLFTTLGLAMTVVATNFQILDGWDDTLGAHAGKPPYGPADDRLNAREQATSSYSDFRHFRPHARLGAGDISDRGPGMT